MLSQDQLSQYLEGRLPELERPAFEARLAQDAEAQALLAEQQSMHFALAALLAVGEDHQRVKRSIFTVLRAAPEAQLAADVMHTARASRSRPATPWHRAALQELIRAWEKLSESGAWRTAAVAISLVTLVVISGVLWNRSLVPASIVLGHVTTVIGEPVLVGRSQTAAPLTTRQMIRTGDRLETGDADRVEIQFNDGTTLQLHFNTIVQIPKRPGDRKDASALTRPPEMELVQGQVWTVVQKSANGTPYAIRTDVATALALGTEFGVKVDRPLQFQSTTSGTDGKTIATVLTVKEGTVEFFNAFGSVQATAMTESTARLGSAPTEPTRLQTLQSVRAGNGEAWSIQTAALKPVEAADKLVGGAFLSGLQLRDLPSAGGGGASGQTAVEVRVVRVLEQSPAERAGIEVGDVLEAIDGQLVLGAGQAEQMLLALGSATLQFRRQEMTETRTLTLTPTTAVLPAPQLTEADRARVSDLFRHWAREGKADAGLEQRLQEQALGISRRPEVRAAAFNNMGVFLELDDRLGAAVRAYGRSVYLQPESALYRMNLGLALRKMGSFERAYEELWAALSREPDSSLLQTRVAELEALLGATSEALARVDAALEKNPQSHNLWELKAQLFWRAGNLEEARTAAWQAVRQDPDCVVGHAYLGGVLRELGRLEESEVALQSALEIDPFHAGLHVELGLVQEARGALGAAVEAFERAIALQPDFARAYRELGRVLADQQDFEAGMAALEKGLQLEPGNPASHVELGWAALQQNNLNRAEVSFRTALEFSAENADAHQGLGAALRQQGRTDEAEAHVRETIRLNPNVAVNHSELGIIFQQRGDLENAEDSYRKALALDPTEPAACLNLAGILKDQHRQLAEAEQLYRRAIEKWPASSGPLRGLVDLLARTGRAAEAEPLARRAHELAPDSAMMCNSLGEILRLRGKLDEAETLYRRALQLDPNLTSAMNNLGILFMEQKQFRQAEELYREMLRGQPDAPPRSLLAVVVNLAIACGEQGKLDEAETLFREALAMAPDEPRVRMPLAEFLARNRRQLDEAAQLAGSAVAAMPGNPRALNTLGFVHLQRGELELAAEALNQALAIAGEEPPSQEIRERLQQLEAARRTPAP